MLEFIPQMHHQALEAGRVICGKFHNEGRDFAAHGRRTHENDGTDRDDDAQKIHAQRNKFGVADAELIDDRTGDRCQDWQLCAAGEEWNDTDGRGALLLIGECSRVDHSRKRAAKTHDHGHERPARKPELTEDPVQNERNSRHVSRIFQNGEKQEKRQDLRDESKDSEHTA